MGPHKTEKLLYAQGYHHSGKGAANRMGEKFGQLNICHSISVENTQRTNNSNTEKTTQLKDKRLLTPKDTINQAKRQLTEWKKSFSAI